MFQAPKVNESTLRDMLLCILGGVGEGDLPHLAAQKEVTKTQYCTFDSTVTCNSRMIQVQINLYIIILYFNAI